MKKFSVWVGGTEVNDQLLTREEAEVFLNEIVLK